MKFPRQEYTGGLLCSSPGDLPGPGIEPASPASPALAADSLPAELTGKPYELEKVFANDMTDKGLKSKIYKQLILLNIKN